MACASAYLGDIGYKNVFEDWCHAESMRETYLPGHQTTIKKRKGKRHAANKILAEPFCDLDYKDVVDYVVTCWFQNTSTNVILGDWAHMPHLP